jgi:ketosteroid isomerase-like protein
MKQTLAAVSLLAFLLGTSCGGGSDDFQPETIIALERGALDRWGKGDPQGYLDLYAPEITYFDPTTDKRIDGAEAMKARLAPIQGRVNVSRYEMLSPQVQRRGDTAVLTFNLNSYVTPPNAPEVVVRWNSTEVYARIEGKWRIVHNHWSFVKPELKQPSAE